MKYTDNFKSVVNVNDYDKEEFIFDKRNNLYVTNCTFDIQCYINYINLLNRYSSAWSCIQKNVGHLDLGMIPLVMGPLFLQQKLRDVLVPFAKDISLPIYSMPGVANMMESGRAYKIQDIWVYREDVEKIVGKKVASIVDLLEWGIQTCKLQNELFY